MPSTIVDPVVDYVALALRSACCHEAIDGLGACSGCGLSAKVQAAIDRTGATWTEDDFLDLAMAALARAGVSVTLQRRVNELVSDELAERDVRDVNRACMEDE